MTNTRELAEKLLKGCEGVMGAPYWPDGEYDQITRHIITCDPASIRTLATAHLALLDEVERLKKVLAAIDTYEIDARSSMVNNVYTLKNIARNARSAKAGV